MTGAGGRPGDLLVRVGAVIVRHAADPRLRACLDALRAQRGVALEVLVVENASPDAAAPETWKTEGGAIERLEILTRAANPGFAAAFNEAWERTRGEFVLSVNPDCRLDRDAVAAACAAARAGGDVAAVAMRLLRPGGVLLDSAGIALNRAWLLARDRGASRPAAGRFEAADDVDAACLAAALLVRDRVERARDGAGEILDSRYFAYQEDVDLGWRLRRAGFRVRYEPKATGEHDRGWKPGGRRAISVHLRRCSLRNRWFTILKNVAWSSVWWRLPFLCLFECVQFLRILFREPAVLPAYAAGIAGVRGSLARRSLRHDHGR